MSSNDQQQNNIRNTSSKQVATNKTLQGKVIYVVM
jgi:hypothetical protein